MYLITYLPISEGFDPVFTFFDRFSKYITFIPYNITFKALELANIFYYYIICKFGTSKKTFNNTDSKFLSKFWEAFMHLLLYTLAMSSGYHP